METSALTLLNKHLVKYQRFAFISESHRETYRDALLEFIVSTENLSVRLRL